VGSRQGVRQTYIEKKPRSRREQKTQRGSRLGFPLVFYTGSTAGLGRGGADENNITIFYVCTVYEMDYTYVYMRFIDLDLNKCLAGLLYFICFSPI
jgi:hypothetical protein